MPATTIALDLGQREKLGGKLLLSIFLHGSLFLFAVGYASFGFRSNSGWGKDYTGQSVRVNAVSSLPGVPLPSALIATPNTLATQNPGLYKTEPTPPPPKAAAEIPKFQNAVKPKPVVRVNKRIQKETIQPPPNAVPFGEGGPPAMNSYLISNSAGEGGMNFSQADFGDRYGWYVTAMRNRISGNWLLSTISPNILSAPRLYVQFDVLRDGTITNVQVTQSSGVPEVDRSALRAVLASNPLGALPNDFSGGKLSVNFYFDFRRH